MQQTIKLRNLESEIVFSTSRSSGPGGQNVNKVNSKVELRFNINNSALLTDSEKTKILLRLKTKINTEGELLIVSQSERTQLRNKQKTIEKFYTLITFALREIKKRKPTKPTRSSNEKRLQLKKARSQVKTLRNRNML
ncbi:MAG: aminoacyl-tRNA hydrolase [Marinilabiliaceae bacterium]|nr:aminoacyl-tRNA hydrolase [Marinilabiliaceae bacterium]